MNLLKNMYKKELSRQIDTYTSLTVLDFQYDPERSELRNKMFEFLKEQCAGEAEDVVRKENRKYFAMCMADLIATELEPIMSEFLRPR